MVTESGSTRIATLIWVPESGSQSNSVMVTDRSLSERSPIQVTTAMAKAPTIAIVPTHPATGSPRRRPDVTRTRKPPRAKAGIQGAAETISALHLGDVVDDRAVAAAEDRHHDAEPDSHLGRCDDEDEEHRRLAADVVEHACVGHRSEE